MQGGRQTYTDIDKEIEWVETDFLLFSIFLQPSEHKDIITYMAKMVDKITVPMARASILWLIGEYSERVPKIAPDVLRKMAKNFVNEVWRYYLLLNYSILASNIWN